MSRKGVNFGDKKINKSNFYNNKKLFKIDGTDVNRMLVSKKEPYGTKKSLKYFTGYNDNDVIRPLCKKLPQMIGYAKYFDSNKAMYFNVNDEELLRKYTEIWEKISSLIDKEFDIQPVYGDNDKYKKTKIKSYGDKVNTNFKVKKITKENALYECLSLIMLDSVIRITKKYYPQTLLEECKHKIKKNKVENLINDNFDTRSSDQSDNESDDESDNGEAND